MFFVFFLFFLYVIQKLNASSVLDTRALIKSTKGLYLGSRENISVVPEYTVSSRYRGMPHVLLMSKPKHK